MTSGYANLTAWMPFSHWFLRRTPSNSETLYSASWCTPTTLGNGTQLVYGFCVYHNWTDLQTQSNAILLWHTPLQWTFTHIILSENVNTQTLKAVGHDRLTWTIALPGIHMTAIFTRTCLVVDNCAWRSAQKPKVIVVVPDLDARWAHLGICGY
jgi:hypothetical protein